MDVPHDSGTDLTEDPVADRWHVSGRSAGMDSRAHARLERALLVGVVITAIVIIAPSFWAGVSLDEGYNLEIVGNLLSGHGYATNVAGPSSHHVLFDYQVTTGPTVMLPVAATAAVLGSHVWVERLVPALFYAALLWCWWKLGRETVGRLGGVVAVAAILMINGVVLAATEPGVVLGESTSTACVLLALLALRYPARCGLLAGLAVMAKVVMLLALPGIALALIWRARRDRRRVSGSLAPWTACTGVPVALWQVVRIGTVGWSGNVDADRAFLTFLREDGAGRVGMLTHGGQQLITLGVAGTCVVALSLAVVAVTGLCSSLTAFVHAVDPRLVGALISGLTLEVWWLVSEGQGWPRHSIQATELLLPVLLLAAVRGLRRMTHVPARRVLATALGSLVVLQLFSVSRTEWLSDAPTLDDQRHVARLVAEQSHSYRHIGPDLYELGLFEPSLTSAPLTSSGGLLVVNEAHLGASTDVCDRVVARDAGYVICWVDPEG